MKKIVPYDWMQQDCYYDAQDAFHKGFTGTIEYLTEEYEWIATYHITSNGISCREGFLGD